ncbi:MAG: Uncharacterized protein AUREO_027780 [Aureobasidium pullulans]|uniref:Apple domain-containing protein n=1 Tax=Aureobasidium pullulans TaxID=5580 RepID=A0A1A7ML81_AURPU|nr:MAG: Uncharacterized protein AUREO_027780 [Aureobasidium pullulans]THV92159.1 hypothetical protein D6D27_05070 [Aureobasidium pullulans]THW32144.1 hypothetical protein D6D25_05562 [Aureobasidium pullulans]THW73373.1 hypothetical protein D6D19_05705 [Aureobasidium pullulans]THX14029.1 hypothetical protein D6D17_03316 [Aureobasidium pullulans]
MRTAATFLSAAALTGLAAASPAPQQLDFDQLAAAPAVQTAPILNGVSNQTVTISSAAIAQSISAAVSTQATAVSTAPAQVVNKRNLDKRTFGVYNWWNCVFFGTQCGNDTPATTSTSSTIKSTSTSASSTKTSSSSVAATATASANNFYLKDANNKFLGCSAGNDGIASYVSSQAAATQFYIDSKTGYLYEVGAAYAANRGTSSIPEITYFSTIGQSYSYITCTQNTASVWLECKANGVFQQAMTCNNDGKLYFAPTIPSNCAWVPLYYTPVAGTSSTASSSKVASSTSSSSSVIASSSSSSSSVAASSSSVVASSTSSGSATINTVSGTTSSTTACPTTPEDGTYCGFINPEDPCAPQPDGYGPKVTPDTADAFLAYAPFHSMASAAPTVVPSNNVAGNAYQQTFRDLNASSSANSYLGLYTLTSYSVADCAAHCDTTSLCTAFNIYIERDPSQNPSKNDSTDPTVWGYWCPTPSSITNFKCTLWGSNLEAATALNAGGWRKDFNVVITGSNGYDATNTTFPPTVVDTVDNSTSTATSAVSSVLSTATAVLPSSSAVSSSVSSSVVKASSTSTSASASATATTSPSGPTWTSPKTCGGKAINAPNYWMGSKFFPGPFNPQVCADYASYQHVVNKKTAIAAGKSYFTPCNSFNAYYLHKNGIPHGTYCALYDASISTSYATYTGGYSGSNKYDCRQSYQYTRQTLDQGRC